MKSLKVSPILVVSVVVFAVLLFSFIIVDCAFCVESVSYEQFASSDANSQRNILVKAFEERITHAKNLYYQSTVTLEVRKNIDGKESETVENSRVENVYSHWQLNDDYRMEVEIFRAESHDPIQIVSIQWNAKDGILKNFGKFKRVEGRIFGRIDTQFDPVIFLNDYVTYWLQGGATETGPVVVVPPYLFPCLLENVAKWDIVCLPEVKMVQLHFEFEPLYPMGIEDRTSAGTLVLDPSKNFMPVEGRVRTSFIGGGEERWKTEDFLVETSQLVSHVWMPTTLKTIAQSEALGDVFSTRKVKISGMSHGTVTESDVSLTFPEGTEVTDTINGIAYKTDVHGNPIESTIEPLFDLEPSRADVPLQQPKNTGNTARTISNVSIVIGIVIILYVLYLMYMKRRRQHVS